MMKKSTSAALAMAGAIAVAGVLAATSAQAACEDNWKECAGKPWVDGDTMDTPMGSIWWPNALWGEGDQAGSTNWYTKPEVVMRALAAVKEGKTYKLGHEYHSGMPMFGERKWIILIPASPTGGPFGVNKIVWHDEFLAIEIGQAGTQFDGLGHVGVQVGADGDKANMRFYNGYTVQEMQSAYGLKELGTEKLHPIVARGILIDFTLVHGDMELGTCANMDDLKMVLKKQGMADFEFAQGDALLFRYNWERHWEDPAAFNQGAPGICMDVARWVANEVQAGVVAGDTWPATDPVPYPGEPGCAFCLHNYLQTAALGAHHEIDVARVAAEAIFEFALEEEHHDYGRDPECKKKHGQNGRQRPALDGLRSVQECVHGSGAGAASERPRANRSRSRESWVATTKVAPCRAASASMSAETRPQLSSSRLEVSSSARMTLGRLTTARARATR